MIKTAADLNVQEIGMIKEIVGEDFLQRQRLLDLGFIPGQEVKCQTVVFETYALEVMGSQYGLRKELVKTIILES